MGAVLAGSAELIEQAWRYKQMTGGGVGGERIQFPSISRTMRGMMVLVALVNLDDADDFLRDLAMRHGIRRLALFGSVLRGEDTPASDIDLLVEFEEGRTPGLLSMAEMELELGAVLGREVELRTYEDLSRYFRDDVQAQARVLYAA
ncbi:MAG: nucleotidyltransferase domain-containing protein [Pseudonocardiaceae bacterium]